MKIDPEVMRKLNLEFPDLSLSEKKVEKLNAKMNGDVEQVAFRINLVKESRNKKFYSKNSSITDTLRPLSAGLVDVVRPLSRGAARAVGSASKAAASVSLSGVCSKRGTVGRNTNTAEVKEESGKRVVQPKRSRHDNVENIHDFLNSPTLGAIDTSAIKSDNNYDSECEIIDQTAAAASLKTTGLDNTNADDSRTIDEAAAASLKTTGLETEVEYLWTKPPPPAAAAAAAASLKTTGLETEVEYLWTKPPPPAAAAAAAASLKTTGLETEVEYLWTKPPPAADSTSDVSPLMADDSYCVYAGTNPPPKPLVAASQKSSGSDDKVEIHSVKPASAAAASSSPSEDEEFDVEQSFSYGNHHEAVKAKRGSSHTSPPQSLNLSNIEDIFELIELLEELQIHAPDVRKEDLVKPEASEKARDKAIKSVVARGLMYHDPAPFQKLGMSEDHAKRAAIINNHDRYNQFEIITSKDKSSGLCELIGIKCKVCGMESDTVRNCRDLSYIKKMLKQHNKGVCDGVCENCGKSRQELHKEYEDSLYVQYEMTLLDREPKVDRTTFFQVARSRPSLHRHGGKKFYWTESDFFNIHTQQNRCPAWFESRELFQRYIFKFGTDVIKQVNCDALGLKKKEVGRVKAFKRRHYDVSDDDGGYGIDQNGSFTRFAGHRHDIIRALHEYVENNS